MKNSFNWFLAIMLTISLALMGIRVATAGESRYSREREERRETIYDQGYEYGYDDGFGEGFDEGYLWGYTDCADKIADWWEDFDDYYLGNHGYTVSEALQILEDYVNGVPVEKEKVEDALWILHRFPIDVDSIISDIDCY